MTLHHDFLAGPAAAPALVLLHGWGLNSGVWSGFLPLLREHFSITLVDLPGFGRSGAMAWPRSATELHAQLLTVAPPHAVWLGWSLGGLLALQLAARYPERVLAVSLCAATPCFVQREDWAAAMPASLFTQFRDGLRADADATLSRFLALQCRGSLSRKADIRFLQQVQAATPRPSAPALMQALEFLAGQDARTDFSALTVPVQVLLGTNDALVPAALASQLQALNPRAAITVLEAAAHLPFVSHAVQSRDALLAFCRHAGVVT